jgi:hypothetical protein
VFLEVLQRGPFNKVAHSTSHKLVNGVLLEVLSLSHLLKTIPRVGHENSHVAMRKRHGWPEESDNEVLHVGLVSSLVGPRQVVCCHAMMSRLAKDENGIDARYFGRTACINLA